MHFQDLETRKKIIEMFSVCEQVTLYYSNVHINKIISNIIK